MTAKSTDAGLMAWKNYDNAYHVLSLGAGRQSSVMYLMACNQEIERPPDIAIFADTGNEPRHVYEQLLYLATVGTIPIHVVSYGSNIYTDTIAAIDHGSRPWGGGGKRWGGPPVLTQDGTPVTRKCTQIYKIRPKERYAKQLMKSAGKTHIVDWRGHTTNEVHRVKPDARNYYVVRWPLLEEAHRMSNSDCENWLERNGHPRFQWSACEICPFRLQSPTFARKLAADPEAWARITALDSKIRDLSDFDFTSTLYLNKNAQPMQEFVDAPPPPGLFDDDFDCDGGACGL